MNRELWQRIEHIFNSVLEHQPTDRETYLRQACAGEEGVRQEVEALLGCQEGAEHFIEAPALQMEARALAADGADLESYVGRTLLHYSIVEQIGHGGMGIVYRARDIRLDRDVAIKVLPPVFANDPERLARFNREARILASLSDVHIAAIHGLEEAEGRPFVVLELVDGVTLADRLRNGSLSIPETLNICGQIAIGLRAAHEKGIVHRDLKPSNVKITPSGQVKILDFGLAKAMADEASPSGPVHSPTITTTMTHPGVPLGTAAYMSPEQATGKSADQRADIWAFGCVLYECLTGKRAFARETTGETIASILKDDPDWNAIPKGAPESLRRVLRTCLAKDPGHRPSTVVHAWIAVERPQAGVARSFAIPHHNGLITALAFAATLALVAALWFGSRIGMPEGPSYPVPVTNYAGIECQPTFSPDGRDIAFLWRSADADSYFQIYRKQVGAPGDPLPLTTGPGFHCSPAWSPDGKYIAYGTSRTVEGQPLKICRIPALGGPEQVLGEVKSWLSTGLRWSGSNLAWTPDSKWLVVPEFQEGEAGIYLLSVETGEKRRLTAVSAPGLADRDPAVSPDGHTLAFVRSPGGGIRDVFLLQLAEDFEPKGAPQRLTFENRDVQSPVWTPDGGEIFFSSGGWLGERHLLRISARIVSNPVQYRPAKMTFGENASTLALSRRKLVYTRESWNKNLYKLDLTGELSGPPRKFVVSSGANYLPEFSPDGRKIAFASTRSGSEEIWTCDADGRSNLRQLTDMGGHMASCPRWSPDGTRIVFHSAQAGSIDLYVVSPEGGRPQRITDHPGREIEASWSHNGKWIYFESNRTGSGQVYRMPSSGGRADQLTHGGGFTPFESPDGKWVFYHRGTGLWKVPVQSGAEIRVIERIGGQLSYALVDNGVYFLDDSTNRNIGLRYLDLAKGRMKVLLETDRPPVPQPAGIAVSPDRRSVIFPQWDHFDSDLMVVETFR